MALANVGTQITQRSASETMRAFGVVNRLTIVAKLKNILAIIPRFL